IPGLADSNEQDTPFNQLFIGDDVAIETLQLHLDITHTRVRDLVVEVISPHGTRSVLLDSPGDGDSTGTAGDADTDPDGNIAIPMGGWTMMRNAFRGETSQGTWQWRVIDLNNDSNQGTVRGAMIAVYGDADTVN